MTDDDDFMVYIVFSYTKCNTWYILFLRSKGSDITSFGISLSRDLMSMCTVISVEKLSVMASHHDRLQFSWYRGTFDKANYISQRTSGILPIYTTKQTNNPSDCMEYVVGNDVFIHFSTSKHLCEFSFVRDTLLTQFYLWNLYLWMKYCSVLNITYM